MIRKILKGIRRAKAAAYLSTLKKQLARLEAKRDAAVYPDNLALATRASRKRNAIDRVRAALAALVVALCVIPTGCAHVPKPVDAIETAVVISEAAIEVCKAKHGPESARAARQACLQVDDIERARDATTALDDAIEAMADWIASGA